MTRVTSNSWGLLAVPHEIVSRLGILLEVSRQLFTKVKFVVREGEEEWRLIITRYHGFGSGRNDRVIEVIRFVIHFFFTGDLFYRDWSFFLNFKNLILLLFVVLPVDRCFSIFLSFNRIKRRIVFN